MNAALLTVHIINHTHWDREWFLTSAYTSRWIPGLIAKLERLAAANPDFRYLLDGQTLILEDLQDLDQQGVAPDMAARAAALAARGQLLIGPYYCQPDWKLTGGELLVRNLLSGQKDVAAWGGDHLPAGMRPTAPAGWLVDTFGHPSQAPQIHRLFGIEAVFIWRGAPRLEPYFYWQGADGSQVLAINLFGGYRNLFGVTHAPEVAVRRLRAEVTRLQPYYPTPDIPLFDGYDLELDPEDPLTFFAAQGGAGPDIRLQENTPAGFAAHIAAHIAAQDLSLPTLSGELNSGKYGAVFPGTLSARTYLKVMAHDCQRLLFRVCEPLAVMAFFQGQPYAEARYEGWARALLQNAVHDCICGVSIDQVHEKMEWGYRRVFDELLAEIRRLLAPALAGFAPGEYALSTNPFSLASWQRLGEELVRVETQGVGAWPLGERLPVERVSEPAVDFTWRNSHYTARVRSSGAVEIDGRSLGGLVVFAEQGDTYSEQRGEWLGQLAARSAPQIIERSARHCVVAYDGRFAHSHQQIIVNATVQIHFDDSPLLRWQVELDTTGTDLRVVMTFATPGGEIWAGMPFDLVCRAEQDTDLLPLHLPADLAAVLLGQRELNAVTTFPMQELVAVAGPHGTTAVLAKGLHAYSCEAGVVSLTLQRAVEWLTRAGLPDRVGDAGPFFYVPGARAERTVRHEVAVAVGDFPPHGLGLQRLNAAFQNPPLLVRVGGKESEGSDEPTTSKLFPERKLLPERKLFPENVPLSSLVIQAGQALARVYNPTPQPLPLSRPFPETDVWGAPQGELAQLASKKIATLRLDPLLPASPEPPGAAGQVELLNPPEWRVGPNQGRPDERILDELDAQITALETELRQVQARIEASEDAEQVRWQHRYYVLDRERLEFMLSLVLNRRKLAHTGDAPDPALYEPDPEIAAIGLALNRLRIKRRIFDYVVQAI